jgi:hypothetical protein
MPTTADLAAELDRRGGGPLAAEAVASGGMIDAPPASYRGLWCAESGLTKALAVWQVYLQ